MSTELWFMMTLTLERDKDNILLYSDNFLKVQC